MMNSELVAVIFPSGFQSVPVNNIWLSDVNICVHMCLNLCILGPVSKRKLGLCSHFRRSEWAVILRCSLHVDRIMWVTLQSL